MSDAGDVLDALLPEDLDWLRAHGWIEPPPRPRWVDGEPVVRCPACSQDVRVEYVELNIDMLPSRVGTRLVDVAGPLREHERECPARTTEPTPTSSRSTADGCPR